MNNLISFFKSLINFTYYRNSRRREYLPLLLLFTFVYAEAQRVQTPFVPVTPPARRHMLDWDPNNLSEDDEFYRSRVPLQPRINSSVRANNYATAKDDRKLIWWCPIGDRNGGADDPSNIAYSTSFYSLPRPTFEVDVFSMWQYLETHGVWGASRGVLSGAMIDQAHRHGVKVLASANVDWDFRLVRGGSDNVNDLWTKFAEKNPKGQFVYVDRMLDFLQHYGFDGMAFNQEGGRMELYDGWADDIQDFFAELHKEAKKRGMDFVILWYDFQSNEGKLASGRIQLTVNDRWSWNQNSDWFNKDGNTVTNAFFLSYSYTNGTLGNSVKAARDLGRSPYDVYAGMKLDGNFRTGRQSATYNRITRRVTRETKWGWHHIAKHDISLAWWGGHEYNDLYGRYIREFGGNSPAWKNDLEKQNAYQHILEEVYSGGYRNPSNTPPITNEATFATSHTFHGVARFITAKSTLNSLPFTTRFSLGNGQKFYDGGEVTHDNEWSNLGAQDYMPSWRWWISGNTNIKAAFTYEDAYSGGSCLRLSGKVSNTAADVHLYKTKFELSGNPSATVTFKLPDVAAGSNAGLSLGLAFSNDVNTFTYFDLGNVGQLDDWTTASVDLSAHKGKTIEQVGISVKGGAQSGNDYEALIGELSITNGNVAVPDAPESFTTKRVPSADGTMYHKMRWDLPGSPRFNGDVWYFDIIKEDSEGNSKVVARTTNRGHYMVNFNVGQGEKVRVVSVAKDGKTKSSSVSIAGNAAPVIADNLSFSIPENSANGTVVGIVQASDPESDSLYYFLNGGNVGSAFAINDTTGVITVNNVYALDFERTPVFNLVLEVSDQFLVTTKTITIHLEDVLNDPVANLALRKPTRQSSNIHNPEKAVDGSRDGRRVRAVSLTREEREPWWEVDLGEVSPSIQEIRIYRPTHNNGYYPKLKGNYYVFVSDVPFTGSSVAASRSQAGVLAHYQGNKEAIFNVIPINRSGRYVRIQFNGSGAMSLAEVEVMGVRSDTTTLPVSENNIETFYTAKTFYTAASGDQVTFSLGISQDESFFNLEGGKLSFKNAPDYEMPRDKDKDNTYLLELKAVDESRNSSSQMFKITVMDSNEPPLVTSAAMASVVEGSTDVLTVTARDPDAGAVITYSISGGVDGALFTIDGTSGVLTFKNAPDFDSPGSANDDNEYIVEVTASDGENDESQNITVTVTDVNEHLPKIISANEVSVVENTAKVLIVEATDADAGAIITYPISGGADSSKFNIDQTSGALVFKDAPDFEMPGSADDDNEYIVEVMASDGENNESQTITVTVTDVNEAPQITSPTTANVPEGTTDVLTVTAVDPDTDAVITYSISGGADSSKFNIDQTSGALVFKTAPDFEMLGSANDDNEYIVEVTASDGENEVAQPITVTVSDVNEAPQITSPVTANVPEGTTDVLTVTAIDSDTDAIITYSVSGGADNSKFMIDQNTGALVFKTDPDFEMPVSADNDNVYEVEVTASDGENEVAQTITVTVSDVNEAPQITSPATANVPEGTTEVLTVTAVDSDTDAMITYSVSGGADRSKFMIDQNTGALTFKMTPDFEMFGSANDDNEYIVEVTASDGENEVAQPITVTVTDVNEAPTITSSATADVAEGTIEVLTITAKDPDTDAVITYSVSGGADNSKFIIDQNTGALTFKMTPDFEMPVSADNDNVYEVEVTASDGENDESQAITVTVTNVNEHSPEIISANKVSVPEGTTVVLTVKATDADAGAVITYSISSGADENKFSIDPMIGTLVFRMAPDFEMPGSANDDNQYEVEVTASDGLYIVKQGITITVTENNEPPMITSNNVASVSENTTEVLKVQAIDPDVGTKIIYSISGGADRSKFMIDQNTGVLTFKTAPDFEMPNSATRNNTYVVGVTASDGENDASQTITVTVTNVDEAPMITSSATVDVEEGTTEVLTVEATDADVADARIKYSISGGADRSKFMINQNTGALIFKATPDFEMPNSTDDDNVYVVEVMASNGLSSTQTVKVTVTNVYEAPVIISASKASVAEGTVAVLLVEARVDASTTVTYSISGGADRSLFNINPTSGELTFKNAPDFEGSSADGDDEYEVEVSASDRTNNDTQTIIVTVTDMNDNTPVITSAAMIDVAENTTSVLTVEATDADAGTVMIYSISGGADRGLFTIGGTSGVLTFKNAPDFEMPNSAARNNKYVVEVTASDGDNRVTQRIAVTVTNVNEHTPVITSAATKSIAENTTNVLTVMATDADAGTVMIYSISSGAEGALFNINKTLGALTFKTAPDFEGSSADGDDEYEVIVTASDGDNKVTQMITVTVTNVNEHTPKITSDATVNVVEGTTDVLTVIATDADAGSVITYSISGGADEALFNVDGTSGELTFKNPSDFESSSADGDDEYEVIVTASDGGNKVTQMITVTVTNVNEHTPKITSVATRRTAEGTTEVMTVTATDADAGTIMIYSISGGADGALFNIEGTSGALTFKNAPDFEGSSADGDDDYEVIVTASDGDNKVTQRITVTVTNVNEHTPKITSAATASMAEGTTEVMTVAATDADAGTIMIYSISGGADGALFNIEGTSGALTFKNAPDFEAPRDINDDNVYEVEVMASDGDKSVMQTITITVTNVNDNNPVVTSPATVSVLEGTINVQTLTVTDLDGGSRFSFLPLRLSQDNAFRIDLHTGKVVFKDAPDFENPVDKDRDNVYSFDIVILEGSLRTLHTLTVTVTDMNDNAPKITSAATASMAEGTTEVMTVVATDADASTIMIYSIIGGADGALFNIDGTSGDLTFKNAPDFEVPNDVNDDNVYEVEVITSDGDNEVTQTITVTVTNDPADDVLGLPEGEGVRLYPNPASGHFILTGITEPLSKVILLSTSGKAVKHYPASKDEIYDVSKLSEGIFFVIIEVEGRQQQVGRIIIRK